MVTFRLASENDYEKINDFHNRIYGKSRTMEQFRWEFHDAPDGSSVYVIAEDGDRIVGTNCVIPMVLKNADGVIIRSGKSEDTLVDPEYRGQNIFNRIYEFLFEECKKQNIAVIWGFTAAKKPFMKLGFEIPFDNGQSLAVGKLFPAYSFLVSLNPKNTIKEKVKILGLCVMSRFKVLWHSAGYASLVREFDLIESNEPIDLNGLLESMNRIKACFISQDFDFQKWRIYANPNYSNVRTFNFFKKGELQASFIYHIDKNGIAYCCQSLLHPSLDLSTGAGLIKKVRKKLFREGVSLVRHWSFDHTFPNRNELSALSAAGFIYLKRGIGFVWKPMDVGLPSPNEFYLSRIAAQGVN
ncbi:MAG: GNAT family N-acetyltransferase [Cryomorphaceae bacterium]|jgi:GNAT superfamily N-acetyltransferase|nr:GNAT family N-acetyltransferase [Cryomorphaceae bacterium]